MKYNIGIIGAGAIGCFVGGHLIDSNSEVFFLGRERLGNQIANSGLQITELTGEGFHIPAEKINWMTDSEKLPQLDLMIFTTKSQDTKSSAMAVKHKLKNDGFVLSLQNGLHNSEALSSVFKPSQIIKGMVPYNVVQIGEHAHFKQSTSGHLYFDKHLESLASIKFSVEKNIEAIQWGKLIKNLNNGLNALSNTPLKAQLETKHERALLAKIVKEAITVLKKNKIAYKNTSPIPLDIFPHVLNLPDTLFKIVSARELKIDPEARASMWQDLQLKRKTEVEYLNGEIISLAKKVGMSVPMNEKIFDLIKKAESGKLEEARAEYGAITFMMAP